MKYIIALFFSGFMFLSNLAVVMAQDIPYSEEAIIYDINYDNGEANIGDIVFNIPLDITIHTSSGIRRGIRNLKSNITIGYTYQNKIITEIWLLNRAPIDHSINDD